jgi:hypothetical protein
MTIDDDGPRIGDLNADELYDALKRIVPGLTREEFDEEWDRYDARWWEHQKQKRLN